jgi:hypothetical protein
MQNRNEVYSRCWMKVKGNWGSDSAKNKVESDPQFILQHLHK